MAPSKRVKKKKSQSSMSKRNENYNNQIASEAETSVPIPETDAATGNDLKPSSEKKKEREVTWDILRSGNPDGKKAEAGKMVRVRYTGKLEKNNYTFDSNYARVPLKFRLGYGLLLKGWDDGIAGMRVGEIRRLRIPPEFGFGDDGPDGVPPNAWLVYDMELVDVPE